MQRSEPFDAYPSYAPLLETAYGALRAQILCVAAELGIAERLWHDGPVTASELAPKLGIDATVLERVLRGLVSMNVCDEIEGSRFRLTALGEYLRPNHPDSVEPRVLLHGKFFHRLWDNLTETVRTGEGGGQRVLAMPSHEYLAKEPQIGALFDRTMASEGPFRHRPAVEAYDFGQFGTVIDVGGGNGALIVEILTVYAQPTGIVFDLTRTAPAAKQAIDASRLGDRCRFIGGDAFETVPSGGDAYVLSNFLVSWADDQALDLLRNCRKVIAENGKVLLIECLSATKRGSVSGVFRHGFQRLDHAWRKRNRRRSRADQVRFSRPARCGRVRDDGRHSNQWIRQCDRSQTCIRS